MARFINPQSIGGGGDLPQDLSTNASPYFDKLYVTHNSDGTNIKIGDDAWIGDVDFANMISVQGVQTPTQGGVVFGTNLTEKISSDGNNLVLDANGTIYMNQDLAMNNYNSLDFKDDSDNNTSTIYSDPNLNIFAYNNANFEANGSMTVRANGGDMNFYMDGGMYIGDSDSQNQIIKRSDLNNVASTFASGSFYDMNSFGPYTANSEQAFSLETTAFSNDVHIGGINNTEIVMDRAGKFNIAFSAQMHVASGAAIVYIWLKKNGTSIPWTNTRYDITANNPYAVPAWNFFVDAQSGDAFEIYWSTPSNTVKVEALTGLTGTKPGVPSMIVTVNQVG